MASNWPVDDEGGDVQLAKQKQKSWDAGSTGEVYWFKQADPKLFEDPKRNWHYL
jgi:hypothetical protein